MKYIISTLLTLMAYSGALAQGSLEFSYPISGTDKHIARDQIVYNPGFNVKANGVTSMRTYINPVILSTTQPYNELQSGEVFPNLNSLANTSNTGGAMVAPQNGAFSVNPLGAATYVLPLDLPMGINGMSPQVALTYSSMAGNGALGVGWNISGLSAISRGARTFFHDGQVTPTSFDATDAFYLDGQRLIVNGASNYYPESNPSLVITSDANGFTYTTPDGKTYRYSYAAKQMVSIAGISTTSSTTAWLLSQVTDAHGNFIRYSYMQDAGSPPRLTTIEYTGNLAGSAPEQVVRFKYATRRDVIRRWEFGKVSTLNFLLDAIEITSGGQNYRSYTLEYAEAPAGAMLRTIHKYDSQRQECNSVQLGYGGAQNSSNTISNFPLNVTINGSASLFDEFESARNPVDFNGDGIVDLHSEIFQYFSGHPSYNVLLQILISNTNHTFTALPQFTFAWFSSNDKISCPRVIYADIDGDGISEVIVIGGGCYRWVSGLFGIGGHRQCFPSSVYFYKLSVTSNKLIKLGSINYGQEDNTKDDYSDYLARNNGWDWTNNSKAMPIDYDHDGINEILLPNGDIVKFVNGAVQKVAKNTAINGKGIIGNFLGYGDRLSYTEGTSLYRLSDDLSTKTHVGNLPSGSTVLTVADINGDGKTEIIARVRNTYTYTDCSGDPTLPLDVVKQTDIVDSDQIIDPIEPCTTITYTYYTVEVFSWEGGQWNRSNLTTLGNKSYDNKVRAIACDLNGDGIRDIVLTKPYYRDLNQYMATAYFGQRGGLYMTSKELTNKQYANWTTADIDGDGVDEFVTHNEVMKFNIDEQRDLLTTILDGINRKTTIFYKPLTDRSVYFNGIPVSFPLISPVIPMRVVSSIATSNGVGGTNSTGYTYKGLIAHLQGRGLLGFQRVMSTDATTGAVAELNFTLHPSQFILYPGVSKTILAGVTSTTTPDYSVILSAGKGYTLRLNQTKVVDGLTGVTNTTSYSNYNEYNIPKTVTVKQGADWSVTTTTAYKSGAISKVLPETITETTMYGSDTKTTTTVYQYSGENIKSKSITSDGVTTSQTFDGYDNFGNPASTTANGKTSSFTYDPSHRFVATSTDPAGALTSNTYDALGNLTISAVTFGNITNITTYTYDGLGRVISATDPDGVTTTKTMSWDSNYGAVYKVASTTQGNGTTTIYHDMLGRPIRTESTGFNGIVVNSTTYNSKGQKVRQTLPNYGSEGNNAIVYDYWNDGRLKSEKGTNVDRSYVYSNLTTIITDNVLGYTITKVADTGGKLKTSSDPGGSISYTYDALGRTIGTTLNGDSWGTVTNGLVSTLTDPDAGTHITTTDNQGRITSVVSPIGISTSSDYDVLDRPKTVNNGEFTTTYTYDTREKGLVSKEEWDGNNSKEYWYDAQHKGRLVKRTETLNGKPFTFEYEYDSQGRCVSTTYPSGLKVVFGYNNNGLPNTIKDGVGNLIAELKSTNAAGQATSIKLGNGIVVTKSYNDRGQLTSRTDGVVDQSYTWDLTHILWLNARNHTYLKGGVTNLAESFSYDELNRLASANGVNIDSFNYDIKGNLTKRSSLGSFKYEGSRPHAISGYTPRGNSDGYTRSGAEQILTYTSFGKVKTIAEGTQKIEFFYGPKHELTREVYSENNVISSIRYRLGSQYELITDKDNNKIKEVAYIDGFDGLAAVQVKTYAGGTEHVELYYAHTDHLGSILALTNANGKLVERRSYNAWGQPRSIDTGLPLSPDAVAALIISRGFTGHEHLAYFGLVNAQGRVYDPALGRFLSPDPYIQVPDFTQNFNRYAYCFNNPLIYTDPDGQWVHILIGAVVGGVVNLATNWNNCDGIWEYIAAFGVGAGAGAATAATGGAAGAGFWATTGVAAVGGAATMSTNSVIAQTGENFSGMNNVNWGQVGKSGVIGGVSGFAGSAAGYWAANSSMLVNGINSPALRSAVVSPLAAGAGHIAGGTTAGLIQGQSFDLAFASSLNGLGQSMAFGTAIGVASTVGVSYAKGISPWTFKPLNYNKTTQLQYDFSPDPYGDNITMYRGTTGSEGKGGPLFMTDNPEYAATYVKNGGSVVKVTIPRSTYLQMQYNGHIQIYQGMHGTSYGLEYQIHPSIAPNILQLFNY